MKKLLLLFLLIWCAAAMAQPFRSGDTRAFDARFGIDGSPDSSRIIWLNGDWEVKSNAAPVVRVPFSYDGNEVLKLHRTINIPSRLANYQFRLVFLGIGQDAAVSLNGGFLALGRGGDALLVDIPPNQVRFDTENSIDVTLSSEVLHPQEFPLGTGYLSPKRYSGIFRDAYLLALPLRRFETITLKADAISNGGRLQIDYLIRDAKPLPSYALPVGTAARLQVRWSLTPYATDEVISYNQFDVELPPRSIQQGSMTYTLANVSSWSSFQPNLYRLTLKLYDQEQLLHEVVEYVGFRDLRLTSGGFTTMNGNTVRIAAATYVEEFPETGWAATSYQLERDIFAAKSLGLNAIRVVGKYPHPYLLRLADRYGLWVLADAPVTIPPVSAMKQEEFRQFILSSLRTFSQHNGNHPSLLALGTGYGIPTNGLTEELSNMHARLRNETGRYTYLSTPSPVAEHLADFQIWERLPGLSAPTLQLTEMSRPVIAGSASILLDPLTQGDGNNDPAAEIRQSQALIRTLEQDAIKQVAGFVIGGLNDYQTHYPILNRTPDSSPYTLPIGVISFHRSERTPYVTIRDYLNGIPVKLVPTTMAKGDAAASFIIAGLIVLILSALTLGQNKVLRSHLTRSLLHPGGFFLDVREGRFFQFGETVVVGTLIALIIATLGAATIYGLRHDASFDVLLTTLLSDPFMKVWTNRIIWNPPAAIGSIFVLILVFGSVVATLFSFVSVFTRQRFSIPRSLAFLTWGFANHLLLLPLALILVKPLSDSSIGVGWVLLAVAFLLWALYRVAAAVLIAFRNTVRTTSVLLFVLAISIGGGIWYWMIHIRMLGVVWSSFRAAGW